jgi:hypothetical protein
MAIKIVSYIRNKQTGNIDAVVSQPFHLSKKNFISLRIRYASYGDLNKAEIKTIKEYLTTYIHIDPKEIDVLIEFLTIDDISIVDEADWDQIILNK